MTIWIVASDTCRTTRVSEGTSGMAAINSIRDLRHMQVGCNPIGATKRWTATHPSTA